MNRPSSTLTLALVAVPALGLMAAMWFAPVLYEDEFGTPFLHRESEWAGSTTCQSCHPDHHASWYRTFHRTMTQRASAESVVGDFESGEVIELWGMPVRPHRDGDAFVVDYLDPVTKRVRNTLEVVLTVGSRRYQQYVVKGPANAPGDNLFRIPLLWHIADKRWIHLNGAFLHSDRTQEFNSHQATWNQNCIFCHNTGPIPGLINYEDMIARAKRGEPIDSARDSVYVSRVAEHGISCESCHAPGQEHADRNRNPLRRYALYRSGQSDPTIVNPANLDKQRSVDVCGQCHGQRMPNESDAIRQWMETGPVYRAGELLRDTVSPVTIETEGPPNKPAMFSQRFWPDGTPRLTAYEYQGITSSACFLRGELTCLSCHDMHDGDVRGQIRPEMRTNQACAGCHDDLVANVEDHTHHPAGSSGARCYECHMPRMMYGVLEIHRSHRIHNPDPAHDVEHARPNACTNCHVDRTPSWAAEKSAEFWGQGYRQPTRRGDGASLDMAEFVAAVLAGDPVQRAVAARLAGRDDTPLDAAQRAFLWPVLLQVMQDGYPTVRYFARKSLLVLDREQPVPGMAGLLAEFDYIGPQAERDRVVRGLLDAWARYPKDGLPPPPAGMLLDASYQLDGQRVADLLRLQAHKDIHIGE